MLVGALTFIPALATLYGRWADGGTGLLITGNVMVDRRHLGEPNNVALEDGRVIRDETGAGYHRED